MDQSSQEQDIQLTMYEPQGEMELQSDQLTNQKPNYPKGLNNSHQYPNNCLFYVYSYFKLKNQTNIQKSQAIRGYGTLVSQNLIVTCAHMIIKRKQQEYQKQAYRIEIVRGNQKRIIESYRFINQYQSEDNQISCLNDVAVLCFNQPIYRQKYIQVAVINSFHEDKLMIPKVSMDKIEHQIEQKPKIDRQRSRIVRYRIKTKNGQSGSPIIIPKSKRFNIFYLVGIHKASAIIRNQKKQVVFQKGQGIIFNDEVIQHIKNYENELIATKSKRFINITSIEIEKRQALYQQSYKKIIVPLQSSDPAQQEKYAQNMWEKHKQANMKIQKLKDSYPDLSTFQSIFDLKDQFKQLLAKMKSIKQSAGRNKLQQLIQYFRQQLRKKTILSQCQAIINEIYIHLLQIRHKDGAEKQNRIISRRINQIFDQLTSQDLFKDCQIRINQTTSVTNVDQIFQSKCLQSFVLQKCILKSYLYFVCFYDIGNQWFGFHSQSVQQQQKEINFLDCVSSESQQHSQMIQQFKLATVAKTQTILNNRDQFQQIYVVAMKNNQLVPYQWSYINQDKMQNMNFLFVKYQQHQNKRTLQQINKALKFYHGTQSNITRYFRTSILKSSKFKNMQIANLRDDLGIKQFDPLFENLLKEELSSTEYFCKTKHTLTDQIVVQSIHSNLQLHILLLNIVQQVIELHRQQYSLCCPLEYCMNINIDTLQVVFFYIGHPRSLIQFIRRELKKEPQWKLVQYYPVNQILDLQGGPMKDFRRVDIWMLGNSLRRLLDRLRLPKIVESIYYKKLCELIERQTMSDRFDRIKIGGLKQQLILLGESYL